MIGILIFLGYYVTMVAVLFTLRRFVKIPAELFRKLFHIGVALSIFVLLHAFNTWYISAAVALLVSGVAYGAVTLFERIPWFLEALNEREPGEVRNSLFLMFFTFTGLIAVGWGWLGAGSKYKIVAAVLAWGLGDAAAALIGKKWGKRQLKGPLVDPSKTVAGTAAMYGFASAAILGTLLAYTSFPWYWSLLVALLVAPAAAITELVTHRGYDTVTVPAVTFIWLHIVVWAFTAFGVL